MKLSKITKYALCAALVVMFASCAQNEKTETNAKPATSEKAEASDLMNIRYIDEDSLLSKYNLAKDLSESLPSRRMLRTATFPSSPFLAISFANSIFELKENILTFLPNNNAMICFLLILLFI